MEYIKSEHYDHVRNDYGREMVIPSEKEWAEVKRGRWIPCKASIHPYGNDVKCSVCGHRMGCSFGYKYCPMCGAKMDKE